MPHINRIRLVNVNYNDAKSIYDDFNMRLDGKSTTYDLINTGGKSMLILMLLQTVLPNTYLKKEKPIKNIFIGGNTKRTSHCLVEWELDEGYEYKYMLTGFCARKKQESDNDEEDDSKLEIDYYNYCYFYNDYAQIDIKKLPLVTRDGNDKIYMSYDKLRQYLIGMKKDGLPVEIFDSKKDYMKRIEYYGLISAEWKLISEINVSENYIEKYFKENKTSRKLIENFLIKIIDNINLQNSDETEDTLVDTLIELKDNLMLFRKQNDNKKEYQQAKEMYENLQKENAKFIDEFNRIDKINKKANEAYQYKQHKMNELKDKIQHETDEIARLQDENTRLNIENEKYKIDKLHNDKAEIENDKQNIDTEIQKIQAKKDDVEKKLALSKAQNEYVEYLENKQERDKTQIQINSMQIADKDLAKKYNIYGYNYKLKLQELIEKISKQYSDSLKEKDEKTSARKIAKDQENFARTNFTKSSLNIENYQKQIDEENESKNIITNEFTEKGKLDLILNIDEGIEKEEKLQNECKEKVEKNNAEIERLDNENIKINQELAQNRANQILQNKVFNDAESDVQEYEKAKNSIEKLAKLFDVDFANIKQTIEASIEEREKQRNSYQIEKQIKSRKLELINKYNTIIPNEDILHLKEKLENKCNYVIAGFEKLAEYDEEKRNEIIKNNPLIMYSVFVDNNSFEKLKVKQIETELQNLVPIANIEMLRQEAVIKSKDYIFPISVDVLQNSNPEKLEEYKSKLEKNIEGLNSKILDVKSRIDREQEYLNEVKIFEQTYSSKNIIDSLYENVDSAKSQIEKLEKEQKDLSNNIQNNNEKKEELSKENTLLEKDQKSILEEIEVLNELKNINNELQKLQDQISKEKSNEQILKESLEEKIEIVQEIEDEIRGLEKQINNLENQKNRYLIKLSELTEFEETEIIEESFEEIETTYKALTEKFSTSESTYNQLVKILNMCNQNMNNCQNRIEENGYYVHDFEEKNQIFERINESDLKSYKTNIDILEKNIKSLKGRLTEKDKAESEIIGQIKLSIGQLQKSGFEYKIEDKISNNEIIKTYMNENKNKITSNKTNIRNITNKIQDVENEVEEFKKECIGLENFITDRKIEQTEIDIENILEAELYTYNKIKQESISLDKELSKQKQNFDSYIKHIKECVENYYIKQDVLESIEGIKNPVCLLSEAENNNQGILTIIELIDERIRHIDEAIEKLEKYQENFITKCFEKAETIVRDLEKLPGLSKIKFGGKDINIIKLELFEYEKDEKIRRMKEYIYKIVQDMEEKPEEMTKEVLNEKLSSKMLVGQIINIDKAYVKLYKIEDVQEHSTYKRWEEDLGSDGQVNAIYFMFAVCIISYISMLTRKDGSSKCKKVIIVDNPFGATSAVFLWKVMFEILKENNVQLIAPGHNISKEIISMFEVNYVLKHEFKDGNKKTVVVEQEFRAEDSLKNMNFDTIDGNQQKLF